MRRRRLGRTGRHRRQPIVLPAWVERLEDSCLRSVAEEVYTAKALADGLKAYELVSCESTYRAAIKSLEVLEDAGLSQSIRCAAGERAMRKFWEAKVCARQARKAA